MSKGRESTNVESRRLVIVNERGLHARAAAKFGAALGAFEAEVDVEKDGTRVSGRSIMGLMMLAAAPGTAIQVEARGSDAQAALDALAALVENRFDE
ncbi:MAG: HPr family phosphocarrier protein [Alphaproteobacteria bacterium]|jgi:phosphocarrier protein HPr|nr:HPr family phosphocarrier protein [Rhodospirillaceae bacterium]MDG2482528.1 HPr family phosphocarrier protein [Alphaproteobacteria bacterium]MBT6206053.1 HPr family phosphocarrier protein [Rhodospirillaceae bacterium]MBT6511547.1 HPr family phosphocarrier protein [Rhodospirillaceae bacterium]MBT7614209.1 HPr family phosphocarrier protein [Rhodospirillaceae bacterium]